MPKKKQKPEITPTDRTAGIASIRKRLEAAEVAQQKLDEKGSEDDFDMSRPLKVFK